MDARSSVGVARACEALERAMRRLTDEIATVRKPVGVHACDDDDDDDADDARRRVDDTDVDSIDALTATLVARTAGAMELDDAPASASASASALWTDVEREDSTAGRLDGRRRQRRQRRVPDDKDAVIRTLEGRCERLESTVWTLRDALEAKRRGGVDASSSDGVAREVLAKEVTTLRRRLTAVNADRERLIELSNELRAALVRRMQSETSSSSSSGEDDAQRMTSIGAAPRVVVEATPVVVVTRRDGDAGLTAATMAPSSSKRETESQKIRLKRAIMRAKERRAAPRVRNWNDVSR